MGWEAVRPLQIEHNEYFSEKTPKACLTSCTDILEKLLRGFKSKWIQNTIIKFPLISPVGVKRKKIKFKENTLEGSRGRERALQPGMERRKAGPQQVG